MLLANGHQVFGVDNLNNAYDVRMKEYRLGRLTDKAGFQFERLDIADHQAMNALVERVYSQAGFSGFEAVINLAARAGVRQSVENPWVYVDTNVTGTLNLLELCRTRGSVSSSWRRHPACTEKTPPCLHQRMQTAANLFSPTLPPRNPQKSCATPITFCTGLT
jgi:dTDP-D-glucose 4,6-dehydratase